MKKLLLLVILVACQPPPPPGTAGISVVASPNLFDMVQAETAALNELAGCQWISDGETTNTRRIFVRDVDASFMNSKCKPLPESICRLDAESLETSENDPVGCYERWGDNIYILDTYSGDLQALIYLHELGHAMGLRHVDDATHLMAPRLSRQPVHQGRQQLLDGMRAQGWECQ